MFLVCSVVVAGVVGIVGAGFSGVVEIGGIAIAIAVAVVAVAAVTVVAVAVVAVAVVVVAFTLLSWLLLLRPALPRLRTVHVRRNRKPEFGHCTLEMFSKPLPSLPSPFDAPQEV